MIAIDFDGVLHRYDGWNEGRLNEPVPGAKEFIEEAIRQKIEIAIFTTRDKMQVIKWLSDYDFPQSLLITHEKLSVFHVFLDDRAVQFYPRLFNDVKATVKFLKEFQPYWKLKEYGK